MCVFANVSIHVFAYQGGPTWASLGMHGVRLCLTKTCTRIHIGRIGTAKGSEWGLQGNTGPNDSFWECMGVRMGPTGNNMGIQMGLNWDCVGVRISPTRTRMFLLYNYTFADVYIYVCIHMYTCMSTPTSLCRYLYTCAYTCICPFDCASLYVVYMHIL